jgi:hypothetical protein
LGRLIFLVAAPAKPPSGGPLDALGQRVGGVGGALPGFRADPRSAERANPPTTSAAAPVPDALPDALTDPDLVRIVGTWPTLPEPIRRAVLALIDTTLPVTSGMP